MDAQERTFNQDPEAPVIDIDRHQATDCCKLTSSQARLLYWYIAPLTYEFCHTFKCFFFHPINFVFTIFLFVWDCVMLPLWAGLIVLCCMGVPLLWITMEFIIVFCRIDLGFNYYMVEDGKKLNKSREHLLTLSLYFTNLPLCWCYKQNDNYNSGNCIQLMFKRMKNLFSSIHIYEYILYHILIRPIITISTWWVVIIFGMNLWFISWPFWYLADDYLFVRGEMFLGWSRDCVNPNGSGIQCDKDYIWIINTLGRTIGVAIISLLVLPLTMRLNNWFAYLNKIAAYKCYTLYFTEDLQKIKDYAPILKQ